MAKKIIGKNELISFPELGIKNVKAKIDTGARTSSIHSSSIQLLKEGDEIVLSCYLLGNRKQKRVFKTFSNRVIRNSFGQSETRYVVELEVELLGELINTEFTLSQRRKMNYPILLGRRFLRKGFLVDVSKSYLSKQKKKK